MYYKILKSVYVRGNRISPGETIVVEDAGLAAEGVACGWWAPCDAPSEENTPPPTGPGFRKAGPGDVRESAPAGEKKP